MYIYVIGFSQCCTYISIALRRIDKGTFLCICRILCILLCCSTRLFETMHYDSAINTPTRIQVCDAQRFLVVYREHEQAQSGTHNIVVYVDISMHTPV